MSGIKQSGYCGTSAPVRRRMAGRNEPWRDKGFRIVYTYREGTIISKPICESYYGRCREQLSKYYLYLPLRMS